MYGPKSMTGFASTSVNSSLAEIVVEARSVNSRYLDIGLKLAEPVRNLEPQFREIIGSKLSRGKIECSVRVNLESDNNYRSLIDQERLKEVIDACNYIQEKVPCAKYDALQILQFPGILRKNPSCNADQLSVEALEIFKSCIEKLNENRVVEGRKLAGMIEERLSGISKICRNISQALSAVQNAQKDKILGKLSTLKVEIDPNRMEQELVYLLLKTDINEEIDRLIAHADQVKEIVGSGEPCGRKLDFLMQELNRETNTIASKSISSDITSQTVELKVLIEQMREQVQNIE